MAPLIDDDRGRWMGATLTAPETFLTHGSAGAAYGSGREAGPSRPSRDPGNGGPCRHGGVLVFRSRTLDGETTRLGPIPITTPERTLIDLAPHVSEKALARALREAIRLEVTTLERVVAAIGRHRGPWLRTDRAPRGALLRSPTRARAQRRRGPGAGDPARGRLRASGAEPRGGGRGGRPGLGRHRVIVEIDGGPFHLDVGEDAGKQAAWEKAGWQVRRLPSDDVYERPERLLALAPAPNVAG